MEDKDILLFRDVLKTGQPNWSGQYIELSSGDYISNLNNLGMNDAISAAYIHPRFDLAVWKDSDMRGDYLLISGNEPNRNHDYFVKTGFNDNITTVRTIDNMSRHDWVKKCCRNEITDRTNPTLCGKYWSQEGNVCGSSYFSGNDLLRDPASKSWCVKNPNLCDTIKTTHCQNNPNNPECGCLIPTTAVKNQMNAYPSITAPTSCWSTSDCNTKTDLLDTFITTDIKNIRCPDIQSQINQLNVGAGANVSNVNQGQTMSENTNSNSVGSNLNWQLIIFIFLIFIVTASIIGISIYYILLEN